MGFSGLSPEAHGTMMALRDLRVVRCVDDAVADELKARGLAEQAGPVLCITFEGRAWHPFESK
jgi:hypothetical protein